MLVPALVIFSLRIADVSMAILRILMVMRGRKLLAWIFGFFQALVFVVAIRQVMSDLGNLANMIGYAAGFATGTVVGLWLEERIAVGHGHLRIMSPRFGAALADQIREAGFAVTVVPGRGRDGNVDVLSCTVPRRQVKKLRTLIETTDPNAFITSENVRPLTKGFWKG
jgi:uncharacterized protein YebE (UPF0316 family)